MSDDNNQKSRGPRKGAGGGGKGGGGKGGGARGPSRPASAGGERKPFRERSADERPPRDATGRPQRGKPPGERAPFRERGGDERPRRFEKPAGEPAQRPKREGRREAGERPFRARPDGERASGRPPRAGAERGGARRFERPRAERPEGARGGGERPRRPRESAAPVAAVVATPATPQEPERIAKVMARAGIASRRDSEAMIAEGRVSVNGKVLESPALDVGPADIVLIDGEPLPARERTRLWLYHKPRGLVTTNHDPEGRPTVFDALPEDLPRVLSIGRLDINTEGLLLLTNDGGLARMLELPQTGWLRRYRVRAFGRITQDRLDGLRDGVTIDGVSYGPVVARFEREQGANTWLTVDLREGKNREVKTVLEHLGLQVNRLIRVSFGPFQLADLAEGEADEVGSRVLKDQLGEALMAQAGVDFDAPRRDETRRDETRRDETPAPAAAVAPAQARRAPSGEDRPRRRESGAERGARPGSDVVRTPSLDERSDKPWKRTVWRDAEAQPQRERKAPPRRGADPKEERQAREATGAVKRERGAAIADPSGRRVRVERVSAARDDAPATEAPVSKRRPDRKPRSERGGDADRQSRAERPERSAGAERPRGRSFDDKPGARRDDGKPRRGGRPGEGGKSSGGKPSGGKSSGGKPSGGKSFGGKPSGGKPAGGRPSGGGRPGGRGPRPGGSRS